MAWEVRQELAVQVEKALQDKEGAVIRAQGEVGPPSLLPQLWSHCFDSLSS